LLAECSIGTGAERRIDGKAGFMCVGKACFRDGLASVRMVGERRGVDAAQAQWLPGRYIPSTTKGGGTAGEAILFEEEAGAAIARVPSLERIWRACAEEAACGAPRLMPIGRIREEKDSNINGKASWLPPLPR